MSRRRTGTLFREKCCVIRKLRYSLVRRAMSWCSELIADAHHGFDPVGLLALEIGLGQSEALLSALAEKNYRDISFKERL